MPTLDDHLTETFRIVARSWRSAQEIWMRHEMPKSGYRAIKNRLQALRAKKLVECRRAGKVKLWRRKG